MATPYREKLDKIRMAFPQPVSDRVHDSYFVHEMDDEKFRDTLLRHNAYNRKIFDYVHGEAMAGRGVVISLTDSYRETSYGEPVAALKSFILSPFTDEENVETVVDKVLEARAKVKV